MKKLPVIVGFGGINAAGRSSFHHAYRRMVHDALSEKDKAPMFACLANLMKQEDKQDRESILQHTLIRPLEPQTYDIHNILAQSNVSLKSSDAPISFRISKKQLPAETPNNWCIEAVSDDEVKVTVDGELEVLVKDKVDPLVSAAGQVPTGFKASDYYNARHQPKGLQLTVFGASDALNSIGVDWDQILKHIQPDEVSVYSGSAVGQMDELGGRGMCQSWLKGGRVSSKQLPLSLAQMSADFINSYVINSVGSTGTNVGACATLLYNLRQGIMDIQSGAARVVIVGSAEAPLVPEVMEGFRAMGALAEDKQLAALDNSDTPDIRRACRPFSDNCGFTMGEAAQFFILMDDELALELGATIYAAVPDVFINADANKRSISSPGVGNYITAAKAMALAKSILGEEGVKHTFAQAHGTGTPQNRVTESHILNEVAKVYGIEKWPVTAIKAYVGHSLGPAAGDQLAATLGVWEYGVIPGIKTIDHLADDIYNSNLNICMEHLQVGEKGEQMKAALLNSKGFGGNNATGLILSPQTTLNMLQNKYGEQAIAQYRAKNEKVRAAAQSYDQAAINGDYKAIYHFGTQVMDENDLDISQSAIKLSRFANTLEIDTDFGFGDYL